MALMDTTKGLSIEYVAGLFDGEGNVRMIGKKMGSLQVCVTNTCKEIIEKLYSDFGGSILKRDRNVGRDGCHRKTQYVWTLCGQLAERLLMRCYPFLIIKKPHVKIVLEIRAGVHDYISVDSIELERRRILVEQLKLLNRKGW